MIDEKKLISHIENQYRQWGEEYTAEQILGDIEDFPKVGEWIPCSEKLPKEHEIVLVAYLEYYKQLFNLAYISECGTWHWYFNGTNVRNEIIAWQPLPEPFKGGENK